MYDSAARSFSSDDWPYGRLRCRIEFSVETDAKKGERMKKVTWNPKTGRENKPKYSRWNRKVGLFFKDGKLFVGEFNNCGFLSIMDSAIKTSVESIFDENQAGALERMLDEAVDNSTE